MAIVRLGKEAEEEYTEALVWYQSRSARAADRFEAAFAEAIERIAEFPEQHPRCDEEGFRYKTLNRYPYSLIYRMFGSEVQVIAVAHGRRKPGFWKNRG